jgi:hypothetical protein
VGQHVGVQVQVEGVDVRLDEQQRGRRQLVLQVGRPRRQRHAVQANRHDHQPSHLIVTLQKPLQVIHDQYN